MVGLPPGGVASTGEEVAAHPVTLQELQRRHELQKIPRNRQVKIPARAPRAQRPQAHTLMRKGGEARIRRLRRAEDQQPRPRRHPARLREMQQRALAGIQPVRAAAKHPFPPVRHHPAVPHFLPIRRRR